MGTGRPPPGQSRQEAVRTLPSLGRSTYLVSPARKQYSAGIKVVTRIGLIICQGSLSFSSASLSCRGAGEKEWSISCREGRRAEGEGAACPSAQLHSPAGEGQIDSGRMCRDNPAKAIQTRPGGIRSEKIRLDPHRSAGFGALY